MSKVKTEIKVAPEVGTVPVDTGSRAERWKKFVERARAIAEKQGTLEKFLSKEAKGEFDKAPNSFE